MWWRPVARSDRHVSATMEGVTATDAAPSGPLTGLRVIDMSTVLAGPNAARYLADFGADVIKVERPDGDSLRNMAWRDPRDGRGLWWKLVNRNKRTVALDLKVGEEAATGRRDAELQKADANGIEHGVLFKGSKG